MKNFRKTIYALVIFLVTQLIGGLFIIVGSQWMKLPFSTAVGLSLIIANSLAVALLFALRMVRLKTFSPPRVSWSWLPLLIVAALVGRAVQVAGPQSLGHSGNGRRGTHH